MAGDADISDAAFADFNEMEQVGSSPEVRIVAQVEFDPQREPYPPGSTLRGLITPDDDPDAIGSDLADIGNRDMTNPQTLREFITWAASRYPARNYLLLLWGHGTGWKPLSFSVLQPKGMFTDQSSDQTSTGTLMAIGDLAGAILDSGIVFDVINLDACLMGMYEVAFELQDCAHYLSFSQGLYPIHGDPYTEILRSLGKNPRMIS
ncbi:MAG: clostripain-related cysteine peptidase, partial [Desulfomonilia bacterium]|nr:clostripain-related cysteine peptidase [Desulfomonilia bacterium]